MINDCLTQTLFHIKNLQSNEEYSKLSKRFHFALSKMIDGSNTYGGVSGLAAQRAFKGWIPCSEKKFRSDRTLSEKTYGDWQLIPKKAWKDSKKKTEEKGDLIIQYFKKYTKNVFVLEEKIDIEGKMFTLLAQSEIGWKSIDGSDISFSFAMYDENYLIAGWLEVSAYWEKQFIKINDLYIKTEYRNKGIGSKLIKSLIDWVSVQEIPKNFHIIHFLPVIDVCTNERKNTAINFIKKNDFYVSLIEQTQQQDIEYSMILAEYKCKFL